MLLVMVCIIGLHVLSVGSALLYPGVAAFTPVVQNKSPRSQRFSFDRQGFHHKPCKLVHNGKISLLHLGAESTSSLSSSEKEDLLGTIRSMRVKELKAELEERKISTADAFEKEELVKRLYDARLTSPSPPKATGVVSTPRKPSITTTSSKRSTDENVIRGELSYVSLDSARAIEGTYNSENVRIENPDIEQYPIMNIQVIDNNGNFPLKLLLDTACSGLLLTPSAVQKHNMRSISASIATTGAGGTADTSGFATQIDRFTFGYDCDDQEILGPLIAVAQDTGVLEPLGLDGIIGLSFLGKYACTEIDLDRSEISLYKTDYRPPYDESDLEVVAEGELSPTRLGIWTVDTTFDLGGGKQGTPIKMLLDTGSTTTILSWKGLRDGLGLSRTSPEVQSQESIGSMGLDNVAMSLTHKIEIDSPIRFGRPREGSTPTSDGLSNGKTATVDIGEIAVVDTQLAADNVAGILGMNVLSKASMIRMVFSGPIPRITLYQKKDRGGSSEKSTTSSVSSDRSDSKKPKDTTPSPATTTVSKVEPENDSKIPTTASQTPGPEETKPKRKKKRRY